MAIEFDKNFGDALVTCDGPARDGCHRQEQFSGSFESVLEQMKVHGWKSRKSVEEWSNYCPACAESL